MINALSLEAVANRCDGKFVEGVADGVLFDSVSIDSRTLEKNDLFVALRGENFNGHDFLTEAEEKACGFVLDATEKNITLPQCVVADTTKALGNIAALNREQFSGNVIGITGSAGKTTVKEMTASILSEMGEVLSTKGNLNNHIGVPLTLLSIEKQHRYAVIEMGASALGEIAYLSSLAKPQIAVVTNVSAAHIEGFGSLDNVRQAKTEIYHALDDGTAVINLDDKCSDGWLELNQKRKVVTFSSQSSADVFAESVYMNEEGCCSFSLVIDGQSTNVYLSLVGEHCVSNALAATACCFAIGAPIDAIKKGLEKLLPVAGRMNIKKGVKGCRIIDDSYNASPASVYAALDLLSAMAGEKVFVFGGMGELGSDAKIIHQSVGAYAREKNINHVLLTGDFSQAVADGFLENGIKDGSKSAKIFTDRKTLLEECSESVKENVVFLVKGSRSAKMEEAVKVLSDLGSKKGASLSC